MRHLSGLLLVCAAWFAAGAQAANVYSVGPGSDCDFVTLSDAVATAAATPATGSHLIKVRNFAYSWDQVSISNPQADLIIEGGYTSCSASTPGASTRTSIEPPSASPNQRLFSISNANSNPRRYVRLRRMLLKNGRITTGIGGGALYAQGRVTVLLSDTHIRDNQANVGGGVALINLSSDGDLATELVVDEGSEITGNRATTHDGGGIVTSGMVKLFLVGNAKVSDNSARRNGGGIAMRDSLTTIRILPDADGRVDISNNTAGTSGFSTTAGFGGAIYSNRAGINARTSITVPRFLTVMSGNKANFGGAVYIQGDTTPGGVFTVSLFDHTLFSANTALGEGGAIYFRDAVDVQTNSNATEPCTALVLIVPVAVPCSLFIANESRNNGVAEGRAGGALRISQSVPDSERSIARIDRTAFVLNRDRGGNAAVAHASGNSELQFRRSIFVGNGNNADGATNALWSASGRTKLWFSTVLGNDVKQMFHQVGGSFNGHGSIIWDPGKPIFNSVGPGAGSIIEHQTCLIIHDQSRALPGSLYLDPKVRTGMAGFRLGKYSGAIDYCADLPAYTISDAYNQAPIDTTGIPNVSGPVDIGAAEADIIMLGDIEPWTVDL